MNTLYKLYSIHTSEYDRKEIDDKEIMPDNKAGFRKGRGTVDNLTF